LPLDAAINSARSELLELQMVVLGRLRVARNAQAALRSAEHGTTATVRVGWDQLTATQLAQLVAQLEGDYLRLKELISRLDEQLSSPSGSPGS